MGQLEYSKIYEILLPLMFSCSLYSLMSYHFPYRHEVQWNDVPVQHMGTLSGKKSEVVKCSGPVHPDRSYITHVDHQYIKKLNKLNKR